MRRSSGSSSCRKVIGVIYFKDIIADVCLKERKERGRLVVVYIHI